MNIERVVTDFARAKWLAVLADPKSEKAAGKLESILDSNRRCCLGHACHALIPETRHVRKNGKGVSDIQYGEKPDSLELPLEAARMLSMESGGWFRNHVTSRDLAQYSEHGLTVTRHEFNALTEVNDNTNLTPQEIGQFIADQFKRDNFESVDFS